MNRREIEQVEREKQRFALQQVKTSTDKLILSFIAALHDEFGFGRDRLIRTLKAFEKQCEIQGSGMITHEYYKEDVERKTGVKLGEYFLSVEDFNEE